MCWGAALIKSSPNMVDCVVWHSLNMKMQAVECVVNYGFLFIHCFLKLNRIYCFRLPSNGHKPLAEKQWDKLVRYVKVTWCIASTLNYVNNDCKLFQQWQNLKLKLELGARFQRYYFTLRRLITKWSVISGSFDKSVEIVTQTASDWLHVISARTLHIEKNRALLILRRQILKQSRVFCPIRWTAATLPAA